MDPRARKIAAGAVAATLAAAVAAGVLLLVHHRPAAPPLTFGSDYVHRLGGPVLTDTRGSGERNLRVRVAADSPALTVAIICDGGHHVAARLTKARRYLAAFSDDECDGGAVAGDTLEFHVAAGDRITLNLTTRPATRWRVIVAEGPLAG